MNVREDRRWRRCRPGNAFGLSAGALLALGALLVSGCAAHVRGPAARTGMGRAADVALVRYSSCEDALRSLRAAAAKAAGPAGFSAGADTGAAAGGAVSQGAGSSVSAGNASGAGEPARAPAAAIQAGGGQGGGGGGGGAVPGRQTGRGGGGGTHPVPNGRQRHRD